MIVPALLYLSLNFGTETQSGAGIPMATDIAFALGILFSLETKFLLH
jgi:NhaA family Na+:H+ antiporter